MELSELANSNMTEGDEVVFGGGIQHGNQPSHAILRVVEQPEPQNYSRYFEIPKYDKETKKAHAQRVIQDAVIDFFDKKQDEQEDGFFYTIVSPKGHGSAGGELIKHIYDGALEQGVDLTKPGVKVIFREVIIALEESGYLETATDDRSAFTKIRPRDIDEFTASEDESRAFMLVDQPTDKPLLKGLEDLGVKTQFTLTYPKRIKTISVAGRVFNTIYNKPVIVHDTDPETIAESVKKHSGSKKSVQELAVIVRDLMLANNILTEQAEDGKFRIKVADKFIKEVDVKKAGKERTAYKELKFDYNGLRVHLDSADLTDNLELEDLTLARMLYSMGFREGGISQEDALTQFITGVGRRDEGAVRDILANLESKLLIQPNGDGNQHLTQEGEEYIIRLLHSMDCIDIARPYIEAKEAMRHRRELAAASMHKDMGAIILGPARESMQGPVMEQVEGVEQNAELSNISADILEDLKGALKVEADNSIDTGQVVLGIDNWQEAALVISEISEIINDGVETSALPKAIKLLKHAAPEAQINRAEQMARSCVWKIDAFVDSTTKEHIPVVLSIQKLYNAEELALASGLATSIINNYFRLQVIGNKITLSFNRDITIKDILGIVKMDKELEALYKQSNGQFDLDSTSHTKSKRIIHSGLNGILHLSAGKFAYYPGIASQSEWALPQLDETLLAQSE